MKPLLLLLSLAALTHAAWAGVPDPRFSLVPGCIGICPAGDLSYSVNVRDVSNANLPNVIVTLDVSQCANPSVKLCSPCPGAPVFNAAGGYFQGVTDGNGVATFRICGELRCPGGVRNWVRVFASGVLLGAAATVTPDVNGDLVVDAQDAAQVTAAEGGTLPQDDLDCNGVIDSADVAIVNAHLGHLCADNLPTIPSSWGTVKAIYR